MKDVIEQRISMTGRRLELAKCIAEQLMTLPKTPPPIAADDPALWDEALKESYALVILQPLCRQNM